MKTKTDIAFRTYEHPETEIVTIEAENFFMSEPNLAGGSTPIENDEF